MIDKNKKQLNEIIKYRLEKLDFFSENSIDPYPYSFKVKNKICDIINDHNNHVDKIFIIAGRIVSMRKMGKSSFFNIQDISGKIQLYLNNNNLENNLYDNLVRKLDIGDIVGIEGKVFYTKTEELSIKVSSITLLSKSIRPLPNMKEKDGKVFFSFDDKEQRYRKRYLDLIINSENKTIFINRSIIINEIRNYLNLNSYIEVETPILQPQYGGANAKPFTTFHNALEQKLYLRIADELYLKRLIVGGFERVYEISKNFRNEGMDKSHNPEFTMLEFYCAYSDVYDIMDFSELMIRNIATKIKFKSDIINFNKKFDRISFFESIDYYSRTKISEMSSKELYHYLKNNNINVDKTFGYGKLLDKVFSLYVEPKLINPTFILDYPIELSPLAKKKRGSDGSIVERFELFINGMEIANAFSELNNPIEQKNRLEDQVRLKDSGDDETQPIDLDFIESIEVGMPPTGGIGIGIDRLVMILTNQNSIKDVILFPSMRNEFDKTI
jgi:lysyl-tRNA synthetase class 2